MFSSDRQVFEVFSAVPLRFASITLFPVSSKFIENSRSTDGASVRVEIHRLFLCRVFLAPETGCIYPDTATRFYQMTMLNYTTA